MKLEPPWRDSLSTHRCTGLPVLSKPLLPSSFLDFYSLLVTALACRQALPLKWCVVEINDCWFYSLLSFLPISSTYLVPRDERKYSGDEINMNTCGLLVCGRQNWHKYRRRSLKERKIEKNGNSDIQEGVGLKTTFVSIFDRNTFKQIHQCIPAHVAAWNSFYFFRWSIYKPHLSVSVNLIVSLIFFEIAKKSPTEYHWLKKPKKSYSTCGKVFQELVTCSEEQLAVIYIRNTKPSVGTWIVFDFSVSQLPYRFKSLFPLQCEIGLGQMQKKTSSNDFN